MVPYYWQGRFSDYAQQDANPSQVSGDGEAIRGYHFGGGDNDWFEAIQAKEMTPWFWAETGEDRLPPSGEIDAWSWPQTQRAICAGAIRINPFGVPDNGGGEANDYLMILP